MFKIKRDQMNVLRQASLEGFVEKMREHLSDTFPRETRELGQKALEETIWYGIGRFWIEGLRTDSLCTNGVGGSCSDALRAAQVVSLLLIAGGLIGLFINHRRSLTPAEIARAAGPAEAPAAADKPSAIIESAAETDPTVQESAGAAAQERLREAHSAPGEAES